MTAQLQLNLTHDSHPFRHRCGNPRAAAIVGAQEEGEVRPDSKAAGHFLSVCRKQLPPELAGVEWPPKT